MDWSEGESGRPQVAPTSPSRKEAGRREQARRDNEKRPSRREQTGWTGARTRRAAEGGGRHSPKPGTPQKPNEVGFVGEGGTTERPTPAKQGGGMRSLSRRGKPGVVSRRGVTGVLRGISRGPTRVGSFEIFRNNNPSVGLWPTAPFTQGSLGNVLKSRARTRVSKLGKCLSLGPLTDRGGSRHEQHRRILGDPHMAVGPGGGKGQVLGSR